MRIQHGAARGRRTETVSNNKRNRPMKQLAAEIFVSYLPVWLAGVVWLVTAVQQRFTAR